MKITFGKRIILVLFIIVFLLTIIGKKYYCFSLKKFGYGILIRSREIVADMFVFGNYDKANWNIILAKKRLNDVEKDTSASCQKKNVNLLSNSISHFEKFYYFYNISKNSGEDINYFISESVDYLNRIEIIQSFFREKSSGELNSKFSLVKDIGNKIINK